MPDEQRLEEQAISQAVERGISSQLDEAENLDVTVRTDLLKAVQGQADSVSVEGKGLVMQTDIRVESMELHTDRVSINPFSILFGQIEFNEPINTAARFVMTEADLNRAMNSDYVRDKLFAVPLAVEGETVPLEMQLPLAIDLQTPGKIGFSGTILVHEYASGSGSATSKGEGIAAPVAAKRPISFHATFCPRDGEHPALLESFACEPGHGISLPFAIAILKKGQELIESPYFEFGNMAVRVRKMRVESGTLILEGEAQVRQMPQI